MLQRLCLAASSVNVWSYGHLWRLIPSATIALLYKVMYILQGKPRVSKFPMKSRKNTHYLSSVDDGSMRPLTMSASFSSETVITFIHVFILKQKKKTLGNFILEFWEKKSANLKPEWRYTKQTILWGPLYSQKRFFRGKRNITVLEQHSCSLWKLWRF